MLTKIGLALLTISVIILFIENFSRKDINVDLINSEITKQSLEGFGSSINSLSSQIQEIKDQLSVIKSQQDSRITNLESRANEFESKLDGIQSSFESKRRIFYENQHSIINHDEEIKVVDPNVIEKE